MSRSRKPRPALVQVAIVAAVAFATRASFADQYTVPSGSMEPTIHVGDRIVVNKAAYGVRVPLTHVWLARFDPPRRGDVVVLDADGPDVLLKRVVAVGGDRVEVREGHLSIDGAPVADPAIPPDPGGPDFGPAVVPDGKLFVLGDNRGNSRDGRAFGWIDRERVLGHARAVVARDGHLSYSPL
jgi:signal peptidase I